MMQRIGAIVLLFVFLFSLSGCSLTENTPLEKIMNSNFIDNIAKKIQTYLNSYPQTPEELAKVFARALKSNDIKKVSKYLPDTNPNKNPMASSALALGGGKDFKISLINSDSGGTYFMLINTKDENNKYVIQVSKFNNRYVVAGMATYEPNAPEVE